MSWFQMAASFLRDAMGSSEPEQPTAEPLPPTDVQGMLALLNRHRAEIDESFKSVAQMLATQNARHLRAMQLQKRWNYALAAALVILAATVVFLCFKLRG